MSDFYTIDEDKIVWKVNVFDSKKENFDCDISLEK